jgi:multiple sugar transport system substrate-binding protein
MKSKLVKILLILLLAIAIAGCGSEESAETASEADSPVVEESANGSGEMAEEDTPVDPTACNVPAPAEPVTVNLYGWQFDIMDFYASEIEKCAEVENIDVETQLLDSATVSEGVRLALSTGGDSPYDIVHGANSQLIEWGAEGWLLPLNDLIEEYGEQYDLADIPETAWAGATIDGQIYGIPVVGNTLHLAYRSDLFEQYNLDVPTNYDEIIVACEVMQEESSIDIPFAMDVSAGWAWEIEFLAFIRSFGGDYLNDDNTPAFNSPEGVAAAEKMKEVVDACMGDLHISYGYEANEVAMSTGGMAFTHIWASAVNNMYNPDESDFVEEIKFAPAAAPNSGSLLGGSAWNDYYVIPATTTVDPELLFLMIMEAVDKQSMEEAASLGIVTRTSITTGIPNLPAAGETIANGVGIYQVNPAVPLARAALGNWMPFIGSGEMTPQEALDAAAEEYIQEAQAQGYIE